jgi:2-methylcitrate dehydratase PrpD
MDSNNRNDTERVARFVAETSIENIPTNVLAAAKTAILDCLGVALAGSKEEGARICAEQARLEQAELRPMRWISIMVFISDSRHQE